MVLNPEWPLGRLLIILLSIVASLTSSTPARAAAERPNVIVVFIDDMGWADFSCFGNKAVETQNIDRLAREGLRFEQFYVNSPICSPSRVALSTGQYPQRWKITSYLSNRRANKERGMAQWLDPQAPMLARILHDAGYATGHFGKWHMGGQRDVGEAPLITEYGFDASLTNFEGLGPRVLPLKDAYDGKPPQKHALGSDKLGRGPILWEDRSKVTESFTAAAVQFIKDAAEKKQPFFVNVWPDDVHSPFFPPKARRGDGSKRTLYHGVLDTMDEQLGVLFDLIRNDDALRDNTLILMCSDNGPEQGAGSAGPFRGFKTHLFEGGVRSPLIAWGPGLIDADKAGSTNDKSVFAAFDLVPSLLAVSGVQPPKEVAFDGEALPDVLLGKSNASRSRPLFFRRPPDRDAFYGVADLPDLAVRDGKWKLLCEYDGSNAALFDLQVDRGEQTDVSSKHPDVVERLSAAVVAWHKSMPPDNGATYRTRRRNQGKAQPKAGQAAQGKEKNVLLILVDDLKPSFGAYGDKWVHSPNLDRLAASGMRFDKAYCNQAVCAPSRNNLLLGSRSTSLGVYSLGFHFRKAVPDAVTMPQYFKQHGYHAAGIGKVFHIGHGNINDEHSWSVPFQPDKVIDYVLPESTGGRLTREEAYFSNQKLGQIKSLPRGAGWEIADVEDGAYADGRIAAEGIKRLQSYKQSGQPFFLTLGFTKPHLPFCAPKKYWQLYDRAALPLAEFTQPPAGAPKYAGKTLGELNQYKPVPQNPPLNEELTRTLIHGYYAALSYMDAQVGRVLEEVDRLKLNKNTIIVLWGDHGYHLGDHGTWTKHTNYEQANRIPIVISAPGVTKAGTSSDALIETVDLFPTIAELAGLPAPKGPQPIDGDSFVSVLKGDRSDVGRYAYHCFPKGGRLGRAIRTSRYRLVEWKPFSGAGNPEYELYDYETDPLEKINLASERPKVVRSLASILAARPRAKPPARERR